MRTLGLDKIISPALTNPEQTAAAADLCGAFRWNVATIEDASRILGLPN